jgi:hypothetical protein
LFLAGACCFLDASERLHGPFVLAGFFAQADRSETDYFQINPGSVLKALNVEIPILLSLIAGWSKVGLKTGAHPDLGP